MRSLVQERIAEGAEKELGRRPGGDIKTEEERENALPDIPSLAVCICLFVHHAFNRLRACMQQQCSGVPAIMAATIDVLLMARRVVADALRGPLHLRVFVLLSIHTYQGLLCLSLAIVMGSFCQTPACRPWMCLWTGIFHVRAEAVAFQWKSSLQEAQEALRADIARTRQLLQGYKDV